MNKQLATKKAEENTFKTLLSKKKLQLTQMLPENYNVEKFIMMALTVMTRNKDLNKCTDISKFFSLLECAKLGLEPSEIEGQAYFMPFNNKKKNIIECQFMLGYKGMLVLAHRSPKVLKVSTSVVYSNDEFERVLGTDPKLKHIPSLSDRGDFIGAYCVVHLRDCMPIFEFMSKEEINNIKNKSRTGSMQWSPWNQSFTEMARKTVLRRLFKYIPQAEKIQRAVVLDEAADRGEQQIYFETEYEDISYNDNFEKNIVASNTNSKTNNLLKKIQKK